MEATETGPGGVGGPIRREELPAFTAASLTTQGPYWKLSPTFARVRAWLEAAGARPTDHPVALFYDDPATTPPEACRYLVAYPVDPDTARRLEQTRPGDGTFAVIGFAATPAAVVEYRGPAADSPAVYARLERWLDTLGLAAADVPRERYLAEPGSLGRGLMHVEVQQPIR